jgi:hypothetical protein
VGFFSSAFGLLQIHNGRQSAAVRN